MCFYQIKSFKDQCFRVQPLVSQRAWPQNCLKIDFSIGSDGSSRSNERGSAHLLNKYNARVSW